MKEYWSFFKTHIPLAIVTAFLVLVSYGSFLVNAGDIMTDMETYIIHTRDSIDVFGKVGRFALPVTKKLFSTENFTPVVFSCYMMATMFFAAMTFDYCTARIVRPKYQGGGICLWPDFQ